MREEEEEEEKEEEKEEKEEEKEEKEEEWCFCFLPGCRDLWWVLSVQQY